MTLIEHVSETLLLSLIRLIAEGILLDLFAIKVSNPAQCN
jgi:hypothetical protein